MDTSADPAIEPCIIGRAHWSVFLPPIILTVVLLAVWGIAEIVGGRGRTVGLYAFIAAAVVVPLHLLVVFLRFQTTRIARTFDGIWIERGWPTMTPRHLRWDELAGIAAEPSVIGRRFGAGTLSLSIVSGETILVHGLADVEDLAQELRTAS
jgi:hypothetical protein